VVPANVQSLMLRPQWDLEFLCSSVPVGAVPHPDTVLLAETVSTPETVSAPETVSTKDAFKAPV
jgi:hypothetical protein